MKGVKFMKKAYGVLTLGDAMIAFQPSQTGPLRFVSEFSRKVGGAELNFAIGCARLGLNPRWISRLGGDEFGRVIYNFARGEGVDVSSVEFVDGYPTSLYFKEVKEDGSGSSFYYRYESPITTLTPDEITEDLFDNISIVHLTGVFLAIATSHLAVTKKVIEIAKKKGIPISFDPNIRLKLWTKEQASTTIRDLLKDVDILLTGVDELELLLGDIDQESIESYANTYNIKQIVLKDGASGSKLYIGNKWYTKEAFDVQPVDTVGAGDGFDSGFIFAYLNGFTPEESLNFANAVGAMVTTVSGDNEGLPYLNDVEAYIRQDKIIER